MNAINRQKAAAERAAAAARVDGVAVRTARERAVAIGRAKIASPGFLLAALASGFVAGSLAGGRSRARDRQRTDGAPRESGEGRGARAAATAAGLLRLLDYYVRRS